MTSEKYTEEFQKALNEYIKLGFNQDECNGFMHGFHKGAEAQQLILPIVSNRRELLIGYSKLILGDNYEAFEEFELKKIDKYIANL